MNLHVFNPEHDLALAANSKFWTAPHAGRQLRTDLGWLPALWADNGDYVLVDDVLLAQNAVRKLKRNIQHITFVTLRDLQYIKDVTSVKPWGWDVSLVHQLSRHGISKELLPDEKTLERQREISDRFTASRLLRHLCDNVDATCGEAWVINSVGQLTDDVRRLGTVVVKAPWSSSGRGVKYLSDTDSTILRWAEKTLKTQGHLVGEILLNKVKDFGMEFTALPDGTVRYDGLSLFSTSNNAYEGSILATEEEKTEQMSQYLSREQLTTIRHQIAEWLSNEIGTSYVGPLGVDMMIVADEDTPNSFKVNPCVEINLRRTMGHVALALSPKENGHQEIMRIGYEGTNYHLRIVNDHEIYF